MAGLATCTSDVPPSLSTVTYESAWGSFGHNPAAVGGRTAWCMRSGVALARTRMW